MALGHDKPNDDLLHELEQVANAARGLINAITSANTPLPPEFPEDETLALLAPLTRLMTGTAEGCFGPLDAARRRLPKLRRQFILTEERAESAEGNTPPLTRGGRIDLELQNVATAVSTALDEYAEQASAELDLEDESGATPTEQTRHSLDGSAEKAAQASKAMDEAADEIGTFGIPSSEPLDQLIRQQRSAAIEAATASAEARMPAPQPVLLKRLGRRMTDYPTVIIATGKIVRTTATAAGWTYAKWEGFWSALAKTGFTFIKEAGDEIVAEGEAMRLNRDQSSSQLQSFDDDPDVDDETRKQAEAQAREDVLAGRETPIEIARLVHTLDISGDLNEIRQLPSPALIANFPNLLELHANRTNLDNLQPVAALTKLIALNLNETPVNDIKPVEALTNLQTLYLNKTSVSDIKSVEALTNLQTLLLDNTSVRSIEPVKALINLQTLSLDNTSVTDIKPVKALINLQWLALDNTPVNDWGPVDHIDFVQGRPENWTRRST